MRIKTFILLAALLLMASYLSCMKSNDDSTPVVSDDSIQSEDPSKKISRILSRDLDLITTKYLEKLLRLLKEEERESRGRTNKREFQ